MAYRNITIKGTRYQYVIGEKFVKFRGGDAIPLNEIGYQIVGTDQYMVTPGSIREYHENGRIFERLCEFSPSYGCQTIVSGLRMICKPGPGTIIYRFACEDCVERYTQSIGVNFGLT